MSGLPGTTEVLTVTEFREHLKKYRDVDVAALKENLAYFLKDIIPDAEANRQRLLGDRLVLRHARILDRFGETASGL